MHLTTSLTRGLVALALSAVAASASAQAVATPPTTFEPVSGQAGKDVVWVPTPQSTVDKMLELTKVTARDVLIDLGSGNGITVITAAKLGATAMGVEFNPEMVALARRLASEAGVAANATFVQGDLFEADLSKATVITLFLLPDINEQLKPKLLELKPGTRIASNTLRHGRLEARRARRPRPTARRGARRCRGSCPPRSPGRGRSARRPLTLTQQYQMIEGTLGTTPITAGKLDGAEISFTAGGKVYAGRVDGDRITGQGWTATRTR